MDADWKDALSRLRGDLPPGEEDQEVVPSAAVSPVKKEKINISVERKGRKGKTATIADGFLCTDSELEEIASRAKRHLGTGGSARGGEILIQGECRERLAAFLRSLGYMVKG